MRSLEIIIVLLVCLACVSLVNGLVIWGLAKLVCLVFGITCTLTYLQATVVAVILLTVFNVGFIRIKER